MSNYVADFALCHWAKNKEPEWLKIEMKNNGNEWLVVGWPWTAAFHQQDAICNLIELKTLPPGFCVTADPLAVHTGVNLDLCF